MKIKDSDILLVNRGGVDYSSKALDLKEQLDKGMNGTDLILVNRNDTDYKVSLDDFDLYLNPVPIFVTAEVGSEGSNWNPYAQILQYPSNDPVDPSKYIDEWRYRQENRDPSKLFNGVYEPDTNQFGYTVGDNYKTHLTFSYPEGIQVYDSIEFKAGFWASPNGDSSPDTPCNIGTVSINGVDILDLAANDTDTQVFVVPYSGVLTQFSIREKNAACTGGRCVYYSHQIDYIKLDGKELLNQEATTLTFEAGEFFDQLKVGTKLQQVNPKVTGVVSKVYYGENKVVLDDVYPLFQTDSTVIIVGADPVKSVSTRGVPVNNDYLLVNREGTDYQTTAAELKEYLTPVPPLILIEDPTIEVNGISFAIDTNSVVTGGKPSYTYENQWFGTKLIETSNRYKSYTVGINNKGQAVLPTSTIATQPRPEEAYYYTVDSGVNWIEDPSDFGAKGEIAWNEQEKCFVCGYVGGGNAGKSKEGPRLVYPESPEKNKYIYLDIPRDFDNAESERFYGIRAHPTLPNTYTTATSSNPPCSHATIVMFSIDFEAGTSTYIKALGPYRRVNRPDTEANYGRAHGEYNGVGFLVTGQSPISKTGQLYLNEEGLFSTDPDKWVKYDFQYSDWAEVCFIEDKIYVSKITNEAVVFQLDGNDFNIVATGEFWRQIGDYVYKASRSDVTRVSCIDGSTKLLATYDEAGTHPTFIDFASGDLAVVFSDGSVKFSDDGQVLGDGNSVESLQAVRLKQTVTDQQGDFVVGSATAEPSVRKKVKPNQIK